jgi:hypothetical protein
MHKYIFVAAASTLLAVMSGCAKTTVEGSNGKKLTLVQPANQTVARGSSTEITVKIAREKFTDPVSVSFDKLPLGVEVTDSDKKIAADATTAEFTLKAGDKADLVSNQEVKVTVSGPDGMKASEPFKLTVKDK